MQQNIIIETRDGLKLSATIRRPLTEIKGVVQMNSGTGIPQKVYSNLAIYLTQSGYVTVTYDYRGIGNSKPKSLKGFEAKIEDWGILDMTSIFDWIINEFPNEKKIIIGHSIGGQLVGLMDNYHKIDKLILIASSTGYWKDMSSPYKLLMPPLWFLFIPLTTFIYGYANAKKIRQGENLPKGVAIQWRNWCINPNYFDDHFQKSNTRLFFDKLTIPLKSIQITDDPIANEITCNKILKYYNAAKIEIEKIRPEQLGVKKIGHTGFFSRQFKDTLWKNLKTDIEKINYA
ncbi:alpha/beta fold hydrolase [Flavobacterium sp.]|uniref:alpha/beta hydrolase family protein n=1 Tax=Flavobacterium sp. TaxID=239 RepID=UPI00260F69C3|nr:alpha/beta fold hydrolase [Flavobacterium sp.]